MMALRIRRTLPLLLTLAFAAVGAQAASFGDLGTLMPYSLSVSPQYPTPYGSIELTPVSGQVDITRATMRVSARGKTIYSGDAQSVSVPLGAAGIPVSIAVTLSVAGKSYPQQLSIVPQDVSLVAEPIASAPPLYPGKPAPPVGGQVRVVAVADLKSARGVALDPSRLVYDWNVDGTEIAGASGIGKSSIIVASPLEYRERSVAATVTSADGGLVGGASLSLTASAPSLRIYETDPLLGIRFDRALSGSYTIAGAEVTLYAAPFSFAADHGAPALQWFLNGAPAQTGSLVTLRPTGSGQGSATVSLTAASGDTVEATANLSLSFGSASGGLFGL